MVKVPVRRGWQRRRRNQRTQTTRALTADRGAKQLAQRAAETPLRLRVI